MKAMYPLSDNQKAAREDLKSLMTLIESVQIKSIESGDQLKLSELLDSEVIIPYPDLQYEVVIAN